MDIRGKKIVDCAGIALTNNGRVFLIRPLFNGMVQQFGLPKGHVEDNESPEIAAEREFTEETGIDISGKPKEYVGKVYAKVDDDTVKRVVIYSVKGTGNEKFKSANITEEGYPENINGCYIDYDKAYDLITQYQQPIIKKLKDKDISSFSNFLNNRLD